jgi:PAS domain S-box-containing protein
MGTPFRLSLHFLLRVVLSDITRRKQVEEEREKILQREQRLLSITESAHDAIFRLNSRGAISYRNPAAELLFGYSREEASGKKLYDLLVPEPFRSAQREAEQALARVGDRPALGQRISRPTGNSFSSRPGRSACCCGSASRPSPAASP